MEGTARQLAPFRGKRLRFRAGVLTKTAKFVLGRFGSPGVTLIETLQRRFPAPLSRGKLPCQWEMRAVFGRCSLVITDQTTVSRDLAALGSVSPTAEAAGRAGPRHERVCGLDQRLLQPRGATHHPRLPGTEVDLLIPSLDGKATCVAPA